MPLNIISEWRYYKGVTQDFPYMEKIETGPTPTSLLRAQQRYQSLLDYVTPMRNLRWVSTFFLFVAYAVRVYFAEGFYIVTYALGIYQLNLFLAFLTPKIDPSIELEMNEVDEPDSLPMSNDEFKPFIRRLPEFKFWHATTHSVIISLLCTTSRVFDVPVFWPILLMYFFLLFGITMKRQILHMVKFKYVPWNYGKKKYSGVPVPKNNK